MSTVAVAKKERLTVDSAIDDVVGGLVLAGGGIGASYAMKKASAKFNPLLVSMVAIGLGIGGRLLSNFIGDKMFKELTKEFASGFVSAGTLDLAIKLLAQFGLLDKLPAAVQAALPATAGKSNLSGPAAQVQLPPAGGGYRMLNGLNAPKTTWAMLN